MRCRNSWRRTARRGQATAWAGAGGGGGGGAGGGGGGGGSWPRVCPRGGNFCRWEGRERGGRGWRVIVGSCPQYPWPSPPHRVVAGATRESASGFDVRMTA